MRKLFKKRLLGIPVAALLILALTAGVVAAGYVVVSGTVTVEVEEAFTVEYSLVGSPYVWTAIPIDEPMAAITGAYPGDCMDIWVRITNDSSNDLWGKVSVVPRTLEAFNLTYHGTYSALFEGGVSVPGGGERIARVTACVAGDAAPNTYTIDITVTRDDPSAYI